MPSSREAIEDVAELARADRREAVAPPQSDIEIRVLGPEESHDLQQAILRAAERP